MKRSISNIAWNAQNDEIMYRYLNRIGFEGIEVAPTRLNLDNPYDNISISVEKVKYIKDKYNLEVSSMQSIWFGRNERIFGSSKERKSLIEYTKKAIEYADAINCRNMVFGSPRNRIIDNVDQIEIAYEFFSQLGDLAINNEVIIAFEPNPEIYNTNFINTTKEAFELVKKVNSEGFKLNLDLGTVIWNNEKLEDIIVYLEYINHVHISEPYLEKVVMKDMHQELLRILTDNKYKRYVSIEMKDCGDIDTVKDIIKNVNEVMR